MKVFVCFALAIACASADPGLHATWSSFKTAHGKTYHHSEDSARMAAFRATHDAIEAHNARFNAGLESFHMAHNEFSDMTPEEIQNRMGVIVPHDVEAQRCNATKHVSSGALSAPASFDLRTVGGITAVKNQGSCGSCYSFSASGALESAHFIRSKQQVDVSEQNIVDCTYQGAYGNNGCGGGWMWNAYKYIKDKNGINCQADYRYEGRVGSCRHNHGRKAMSVTGHVIINKGDENAIKEAVCKNGAVSIAYNAGTQAHSSYNGGILDVANCGNTPTHATLVVGYGTENGRDYWIIKNSWGPGWGEKGYFRMARGKNMCGIGDWASYPIAA
jgi:C1A family cysteine protease